MEITGIITGIVGLVSAYLVLGWRYLYNKARADAAELALRDIEDAVIAGNQLRQRQAGMIYEREEELKYWRDLYLGDLSPDERVNAFDSWQQRMRSREDNSN